MALYVKQSDDRSELQKRLATELQEKAKQRAKDAERPDGVDDSRYMENTKPTTSLAWLWALIAVAAVGLVVWFAARG